MTKKRVTEGRMVVYFDESYDNPHTWLLLGALFNPHHGHIHRQVQQIKDLYKFYNKDGSPIELKYSDCLSKKFFSVCAAAVDVFTAGTSWFRAVAIDQTVMNLRYFGGPHEPKKIKMARAYKKFAELLFANNTRGIANAVLFTDKVTRCRGDFFLQCLGDEFSKPGQGYCIDRKDPIFKHIHDIDSKLPNNHVSQINDILLGCILAELSPPKNQWKNSLKEHLKTTLGIPSLSKEFWSKLSKRQCEESWPKYNVWYWKPGE